MSRALLIGKAPAAELGFTYTAEEPYDAVVIGSLSLGELLHFRQEQVLLALSQGKTVYLYTPGLPEAEKNRGICIPRGCRRRKRTGRCLRPWRRPGGN